MVNYADRHIKVIKKKYCLTIIVVATILILFSIFKNAKENLRVTMNYQSNIINETTKNTDFRRVLFTGNKSQLVVMNIPAGGEVGKETHKYTEQTLFFLSGTGEGELNGKKFSVGPGDVVVVTAGTEHNFWNTGTAPLKIYTVYAPPNHLEGLIEATKAEADANTADEAVGNHPPTQ